MRRQGSSRTQLLRRSRLLLPDGLIKSGQADGRGVVREESLPSGHCDLELIDEPPSRS